MRICDDQAPNPEGQRTSLCLSFSVPVSLSRWLSVFASNLTSLILFSPELQKTRTDLKPSKTEILLPDLKTKKTFNSFNFIRLWFSVRIKRGYLARHLGVVFESLNTET